MGGDIICSWYPEQLELFWCGTSARRKHLKEVRGFDCGCERCAAPDALRSFECESCGGRVAMTSLTPTEQLGVWSCNTCHAKVSDDDLPLDFEAKALSMFKTSWI